MSRTENRDGKIQALSLEEIRGGLHSAARRIREVVKRPGRKLEEGPVLSRLAAWFLIQEPEIQNRIIGEGHALIEKLKLREEPGEELDKEAAERMRREQPGAMVVFREGPKALGQVAVERDVPEPGEDDVERFDRNDKPVDLGGERPARKRRR